MFVFLVLLSVLGGFAMTWQKTVCAALGERIGGMESSFINHIVGAILAGLLLAAGIRTGQISFSGIPFYFFLAGCLGVFYIYLINYTIPIIGIMATLICLILSQLITSSVIDHYGLLNSNVIKFGISRAIGIILITIGTILVLSKSKSNSIQLLKFNSYSLL